MKKIDLDAGSFAFIESGSASDPPIVLLHAMGRSSADWHPIIERLTTDYRVIALDMRGHGDSCRPGDYSFELMRDDLLEFANKLGLEQFHLMGHSLGATTSILFAERWPNRIDHLVLEDTPPPSGNPSAPMPPAEPPEPVSFDWPVITQIVAQLNDPDPAWWDDLGRITAPTLIIGGGDESFLDQAELAEAASRIPGGRFTTIEAGHHIHSTRPDEFLSAVVGFLAE